MSQGSFALCADGNGVSSFMWGLYPENLRWTTGGDYLAFSKLVKRFLEALDILHCRPYFVFDGECLCKINCQS